MMLRTGRTTTAATSSRQADSMATRDMALADWATAARLADIMAGSGGDDD